MTHNQWEQGERLTIHNATKEQLKFMVKERESIIQDLTKQLDEKRKVLVRNFGIYTTITMLRKMFTCG